jgi:hypothetical protein
VSGLTLTPRSFPAATTGPSARNAVRPRRLTGTRVGFRLNVAASVRFTVQRRAAGRRVRGRCVAPTRSNRRAAPCVRYPAVPGSFTRKGNAGANAFRFTGRVGGRRLPAWNYRLVATPALAGRAGTASRGTFRVVP